MCELDSIFLLQANRLLYSLIKIIAQHSRCNASRFEKKIRTNM